MKSAQAYQTLTGPSHGSCIPRVFDPRTDDRGESTEEMSACQGGELVTTDKSAVDSRLFLDEIVVGDGQNDGCFPDSSCTDESEWSESFCEADDFRDQLFAPETGPRRRRGDSRYTRYGW